MKTQKLSFGIRSGRGPRLCRMPRAGGTQPQKYSTSKAASHLPVNIHLTGCPNSCALHYMGDIGCLGTKSNGQDAYHVFVGGGFGKHQSVGRQIFAGVTATELANTVEKLLKVFSTTAAALKH